MATNLSRTEQADYLEQAADYLTIHGHCKGAFENDMGQVCMTGAINSVLTGESSWSDSVGASGLYEIVSSHIVPNEYCNEFDNITDWNDDSERTQGEVEDLFRTVAKDLRNG